MSEGFEGKALDASNLLKAISHEGRLKILCYLMAGERSVTEIQEKLSLKQAAASQQLGRLRLEGLISMRREGKNIYYRVSDARVSAIVGVLYELFCREDVQ